MLCCHPVACINMAPARGPAILTVRMSWRWCVVVAALLGAASAATLPSPADDEVSALPSAREQDDYLLKQVVWKRCYRKITPACLKLNLVRTVELMSKDSSLALVPGVFFSSNSSEYTALPPDIARSLSSEQAPLDDLVSFTVGKYLRSLSLNVNIVDFVSGGNETLQRTVIDAFTGRAKKNGLMGYGAVAAMMGGMMASMMMAALAALAGKAMMTSLLALIMAAFAAMKGGGGGGGGTKTYEVITKPVVSHVDTHSSEVQHEHHGHYHKRSLELGGGQEPGGRQGDRSAMNRPTGSDEPSTRHGSNTEYYQKVDPMSFVDLKSMDEKYLQQRKNSDFIDKLISREEREGKMISSERDFGRLEHPSSYKTTQLTSISRDSSGNTPTRLVGHPRQNYKEFRRNSDDDLLMAFGLFR